MESHDIFDESEFLRGFGVERVKGGHYKDKYGTFTSEFGSVFVYKLYDNPKLNGPKSRRIFMHLKCHKTLEQSRKRSVLRNQLSTLPLARRAAGIPERRS